MLPEEDMVEGGYARCAKLNASLCVAQRNWENKASHELQKLDFKRGRATPCILAQGMGSEVGGPRR